MSAVTLRLLQAITGNGARRVCPCGFPVPANPGKYTSTCPSCDAPVNGQAVSGPEFDSGHDPDRAETNEPVPPPED